MKVSYTGHAKRRMRDRQITQSDVEAVLVNYHTSRPADAGATMYVGRDLLGKTMAVVLLPPGLHADTVRVKTVWRPT
jgi:hypothetical protein